MSRHLFWLSNKAWAAIEPYLPRGRPGNPRVDDRRVIVGILHALRTGCRWRNGECQGLCVSQAADPVPL